MRFRYILPAALLTAGSAMAQAGAATPNAIGIWNSNGFLNLCWFIGTGFPAGSLGNQMWQCLPPQYTSYYRNVSALRELDFRGFEIEFAYFTNFATYSSPNLQVRNAIPNPANTTRCLPGATIYANFPSIAGLIAGGNPATGIRYCVDLGAGTPIPTAPAGVGEGLMFVWNDFDSEYGDGNGPLPCSTLNEPATGGAQAISYSGGSTSVGQNFILPNFAVGANPGSGEYGVTWFFEQSMIQIIKESQFMSSGATILGGGAPPAAFNFQMTDGRGGIYINPGDVVSYNGNMTYGNPVPGIPANVWFSPFVLFSGDVIAPGVTDPLPETWADGTVAFMHCKSLQQWIDEFCAISGSCPPGTGAVINPANSFWCLWMGLDLANGFLNLNVLFNGVSFADVSSGFQWAGPTVTAFQSITAPAGLICRNPVNGGAGILDTAGNLLNYICEHRTMLCGPQSGYTPVVTVGGGPFLGFGTHPGSLPPGSTFSVQCWVIDLGVTQVIEMSNVATCLLQ